MAKKKSAIRNQIVPEVTAVIPVQKNYLFLIIIIALTFLSYLKIYNCELTNWDDPLYVNENKLIQDLNSESFSKMFSVFYIGNYHPLTLLTYAIDYHFFKLNPTVYHFHNLIWHLLCCVSGFYFVKYLFKNSFIAFIAILIFSVQPMHVESVAWVSGRKDMILSFFYFCSLLLYMKYSDCGRMGERESGRAGMYYIGSLVLFVLSLMAKATAVTLPIILILLDLFKKRKINIYFFTDKILFFALSLLFGVLSIYAQKSYEAIMDIRVYPFIDRIILASYCLTVYIFKMFVPIHLSAFYPYPIKPGESLPWLFYFSSLVILFISYLLYRTWKFSTVYVWGGLFFLITVILLIQLLPVGDALIAERYTYLPYLGLCIILASGTDYFYKKEKWKKITIATIIFFVTLLSIVTFQRVQIWQNSETLWKDVVRKFPNVPHSYTNLGQYYFDKEKFDLAILNYEKALAIDPLFFNALQNKGAYLSRMNQFEKAIEVFNKSLQVKFNSEVVYYNRGICYAGLGMNQQAIDDYTKALQFKPDHSGCYMNRGVVFGKMGKVDEALNDFNHVIQLKPFMADAYSNRGNLYDMTKQYNLALADYSYSIELDPKNHEGYFNRGRVYYSLAKYKLAIQDLSKAISMNPSTTYAYYFRGLSYKEIGDSVSAKRDMDVVERAGVK